MFYMQKHNNCVLGSWQRDEVEAEGLDKDKTVIIWQHVLASVSGELQDGLRSLQASVRMPRGSRVLIGCFVLVQSVLLRQTVGDGMLWMIM